MLAAIALFLLGTPAVQDRPPAVSIRLDPPGERTLSRHTRAKVSIRTDREAYVTVFRVDTEGRLTILYPEHPWEDNRVRPGRTYQIRAAGAEHSFMVESEPGVGYLFAVASAEAFDYRKAVRGGRWDYASLLPDGRLSGDPYASFMRVAEQISQGKRKVSGSTLLAYRVEGQYEYPRFVCYDCHAPATQPAWDPYERTCPRFALVRYSDPKAGYRYGFRDLWLNSEGSPRDSMSGVLNLRRSIPWISRPGPTPRQPEFTTESEPWPSLRLRDLIPRLERRSAPVSPEPPNSSPPRDRRRQSPPR